MKKIFVLGDSISIHYGPYLEQYVKGNFLYERKGRLLQEGDINEGGYQNGGDSKLVLEYLTEQSDLDYDILLLNCGLHDIRVWDGVIQVDEYSYAENLKKAISMVQERGKMVIWISSTPIDDEKHNAICERCRRYDKDVQRYNTIAANIMQEMQIPIIDLYSFTKNLEDPLYEDHAHFNIPIRKLQAAFIAGSLLLLVQKKQMGEF